jgi:hypothetical protein
MTEPSLDKPYSQPVGKRYNRPRRMFSWVGLVIGLALGIGAGLAYAWIISPVTEFDTAPWQLNHADRLNYMAAAMLDYAHDGDLNHAIARLLDLHIQGDPIQAVADAACELATTGYVDNSSGVRAVRAMMMFYQLQGKTGCADKLMAPEETEATNVVEVIVPTATLVPPPTKTPVPQGTARPTPTPFRVVVPTSQPEDDFTLSDVSTFCDANESGVIQVFVQQDNGDGIPGQTVRVRWDAGSDTFVTGLKPERGAGYADYQMTDGVGYLVDLPDHSPPAAEPLTAVPCTAPDGQRATTSYRVVFSPS